jgi:hypothetical protein
VVTTRQTQPFLFYLFYFPVFNGLHIGMMQRSMNIHPFSSVSPSDLYFHPFLERSLEIISNFSPFILFCVKAINTKMT